MLKSVEERIQSRAKREQKLIIEKLTRSPLLTGIYRVGDAIIV